MIPLYCECSKLGRCGWEAWVEAFALRLPDRGARPVDVPAAHTRHTDRLRPASAGGTRIDA